MSNSRIRKKKADCMVRLYTVSFDTKKSSKLRPSKCAYGDNSAFARVCPRKRYNIPCSSKCTRFKRACKPNY